MLRFTVLNLKLISDIEKYQVIESTMRKDIPICKRYVEANNIFLKSYDTNKPTSYVIYLDANNLHGYFLIKLLPTEILDWVNPKDFNLDNYSKNS